ncbi:hypothetical protein HY640_04945 [Candidatus Woesearchaeota archaeon]|nr:hypothetical protein [Candidatus Woesearchaeota archaeon]
MKHSIKTTVFLVSLFLLAQIVGLKVVDSYIDKEATRETGTTQFRDLPYSIERPDVNPTTSVWMIVIAMLVGTGLLLLLIRWRKINFWRAWFFLSVLLTLSIALSAFINSLLAFTASLILAFFKVFRPSNIVHNATEIFIYGGLAAIFVPILTIAAVSALLLIISAYDAYAVWKSRHMVKLAKFQASANLFSGIHIARKETKTDYKPSGRLQKVRSAFLGGGDIGFPLIFAGVAMKNTGFLPALVITLTATIALTILIILGEKNKYYPAMPFLTAGCFAGYAALQLLPL